MALNTTGTAISTTVLIVQEWLKLFRNYFPDISFTFSNQVDYDIGLNNRRDWKITNSIFETVDVTPLVLWNRDPLIVEEPLRDRGRYNLFKRDSSDELELISAAYANLNLKFMYITNNMSDLEVVEIIGLSAMQNIEKFTIDFAGYGEFSYICEWKDFDELIVNRESSSYFAIAGTVTIQGLFFAVVDQYPRLKKLIVDGYAGIYPSVDQLSHTEINLDN